MTFRVGQKMVCVDAKPRKNYAWSDNDGPVEGAIYTIIRTLIDADGDLILHLAEIARGPIARREHGNNAGYIARRFRPIVEPKTEISFTAGADPSSDQFDNRRKVRKKVTT